MRRYRYRNEGSSSSGGVGFVSLLALLFIALKLLAIEPVANWSWWWVTSPLWGSFLLYATVFVGAFLWFRSRV